jgi:diguanylate cyclase (GGDEF)-like protein
LVEIENKTIVTNRVESDAYQRLIQIGLALSAEKQIDSLLEHILQEAKSLANADAGSVYLKTDQDTLRFAIIFNDSLHITQGGKNSNPILFPEVQLLTENGQPNMTNIASRGAILGETIVIDDIYDSEEFDFSGTLKFDELTGYHSVSFLSVPLKTLSGEVMGILQLLNAKGEDGEVVPFSDEIKPIIEALSSQASVAMENRYLIDEQEALKRQLEHEVENRTEELKDALSELSAAHIDLKVLTTIDAVTGIRNRKYFDDVFDQEWRRALRQQYEISLLMLDIDHFKKVNDTYGHLAGDECLLQVAQAIDGMLNRPSDVVARYGGEEFIVILPYVTAENARHVADQIRSGLADLKFAADGHQIGITVSIGVSSTIPVEDGMPRDMISQSDEALYRAKSTGRNKVCLYGD